MKRRLFFPLVASLLLAGCGFQLHRQQPAFNKLAVNIDYNSSLAQRLKFFLQQLLGVQLVAAEQAQVKLDILADDTTNSVSTYDSDGFINERYIKRSISFRLRNAKTDKIIIAPTTFSLDHNISYAENLALAKQHEIASLLENMEQEILQKIIFRLSALPSID